MTTHLQKELEKIKKMLLSLGTMVEERVRMAILAIEEFDGEIAQKVISSDYEIDDMEVEIEEECLKAMALYQPVAVDLRFLVTVIKMNNDLERIGDQAVNIAQRMQTIAKKEGPGFIFDYSEMAQKAESMLKMSLDALVNLDLDLAYKVLELDDQVDEIQKEAYRLIKRAMPKYPDNVAYLINLLLVSRHLERLADHATNIAEDVIYMIEGEIIRHVKS